MSLSDTNNSTAVIPSITGSPQLDTQLRYLLIAGSSSAATWMATQLGINDPNLIGGIALIALAISTTLATAGWGALQNHLTKKAVVEQVVHAAITSEIPAPVIKAVTPEQEVRITDALNAGQLKAVRQ